MTTTTVRIFTSPLVPNSDKAVAQVTAAAAGSGLATSVINADVDIMVAIERGIVGLPAVIVETDGVETGRRECVSSGRGLRRWLDKSLTQTDVAVTLQPAFA
jgi:hypothetical protein